MKWSNVFVSVAVVSIHSRPVVAETAERCQWNELSKHKPCTSKEMLAVSRQTQQCDKQKDQTACANQSDCVWAQRDYNAFGVKQSGPPQCITPRIVNQTSVSCRKHSKESCGKNTGCGWRTFSPPKPFSYFDSCMPLGSIAEMNSAGSQKATFFCSRTDFGHNFDTKEVCEGKLISPWLANACYAHDYAMRACMKKSPDTSACGKINADLLCFKAHPCYEIKRDAGTDWNKIGDTTTSTSMKTDCEKSAKLECSSECSILGAEVVTPSMQKAGATARMPVANATASKTNQGQGVGASGVLLVAVLEMRLIF
jgi:hypothetical protein